MKLDFPEIVAPAVAPAPAAEAPKPPAKVSKRTELALLDMQEVALARFGDWRPDALALVEKYRDVAFDLSTTKGYKALTEAIAEVRAPRFKAQNVDKDFASEVTKIRKAVGAEKDAVIKLLEATETHLVEQKDAHDKKVEEDKAREKARKDAHLAAIERIKGYAAQAHGLPSDRIQKGIDFVATIDVSASSFEEFAPAAEKAKADTLAKLSEYLAKAVDDARIRAENEARQIAIQAIAEINAFVTQAIGGNSVALESSIQILPSLLPEGAAAEVTAAYLTARTQLDGMLAQAKQNEEMAAQLASMMKAAEEQAAKLATEATAATEAEKRSVEAAAPPAPVEPIEQECDELKQDLATFDAAVEAAAEAQGLFDENMGEKVIAESAAPIDVPRAFRRVIVEQPAAALDFSTPAQLRNEWMLFEHALALVLPTIEKECAAVDSTRFLRSLERVRAIFA